MRNQTDVDKVVLVFLKLTWDMLTRVPAVSTSDNDHQSNIVGKDVEPVTSLRLN